MMRKSIFLVALFSIICSGAWSQIPAAYHVFYKFVYIRDLANKSNPYTADMVLTLGNGAGRYCTERLFSSMMRSRNPPTVTQTPSGGQMITVVGRPGLSIGKQGALINEEIVKNHKDRELTFHAMIGVKLFRVETGWPVIHWDIQDEKKTIGQFSCQKAIGSYGGRTYTAWFTTELPFPDGPWKLCGLPGLILEATDKRGEVKFLFKEIKKNTDQEVGTEPIWNPQREMNSREYRKLMEAYTKDPIGFSAAQYPDAKMVVRKQDDPDGRTTKVKKYNPLEL